jgi:hypothetical protein
VREPQEQEVVYRMPQFRDCPSAGFSTATKIVTRAKTKLTAPNRRSRTASAAKASVDPLPWTIFDATSRRSPPTLVRALIRLVMSTLSQGQI